MERTVNTFGEILRHWRTARRMSQLNLGLEAQVSTRHISFIETGRANPSREMILMLANVLGIPLRERNALFLAAGFAPVYRETNLADPQMAEVRKALELILKQQESFGAIAFDRYWDIVMVNHAYATFINRLFPGTDPIVPYTILPEPRMNLVRQTFDPSGIRPFIVNWEQAAKSVLTKFHYEVIWSRDETMRRMLQSILAYPGIPDCWREPSFDQSQSPLIPLELRLGSRTLRLITTITTLGSPLDVTLQELRIEAYHPADEQSVRVAAEMVPELS